MYIKIGKLIITNEEIIRKSDVVDEDRLRKAFYARLSYPLRKHCVDDIFESALTSSKKA